jgi:hypothetical protein
MAVCPMEVLAAPVSQSRSADQQHKLLILIVEWLIVRSIKFQNGSGGSRMVDRSNDQISKGIAVFWLTVG